MMDKCKEGLQDLKTDLDELKEALSGVEIDEKFMLENKDTLKDLFSTLYEKFEEIKSCPLPAVKIEENGKEICKDTSILLEPVVGRYIPVEDLLPELDALVEAAAVGKFKDRFDMLYKYVKSAADGLTCEIPEQVSESDVVAELKVPQNLEGEDEEAVKEKAAELLELVKNPPRNEVSKRRQWFKDCMKSELEGKKADDRVSWREKFRQAAKKCAAENPYPKK